MTPVSGREQSQAAGVDEPQWGGGVEGTLSKGWGGERWEPEERGCLQKREHAHRLRERSQC